MISDNKKTILLVEDEAVISIVHKKSLENYGYNIIIANSGEKAIELFKTNDAIDLILMDIDLGAGIDGTETADIILKLRDIPVVFLSSHTEPAVVGKTEKITSYGYVVKNSGITVLDASIKMAFKLFNANEEISEQSARNLAIVQALPDLMFVIDHNGIYREIYASDNRLLPIRPDELIGKTLYYVFEKNEADKHLDIYRTCIESGIPQVFEYELIVNESRSMFEARIARFNYDSILAIVRDITFRKQSEEEIRAINEELTAINEEMEATNEELIQSNIRLEEQEQKFRSLFENTGSGIIVIEEDTTISLANDEFARNVGFTRDEIEGKIKWPDLVFKDDIESMIEQHKIRRLNPDSARSSYEFRFKVRSGKLRDTLLFISMIPGTKKSIATLIDITDRKDAEKNLQKNEEQYYKTVNALDDYIHVIDNDFRIVFCNDAFNKALIKLNIPDNPVGLKIFDLLPVLKEKSENEYHKVFNNGIKIITEESVFFNNEIQWSETRKIPLQDADGRTNGVVTIIHDITERKNYEESLRESEERFRALHNASFGGIAIHDNGIIIECNAGLSEITGYTRDELIGMNGLILCAESSREAVVNNIKSGYEKAYEIIGVKKNGEEYSLRIEARNIPYKGKQVRVTEFRDITENKIAENNLKEKNLFINSLLNAIPVAVFYKDINGRYLGCNNVFSDIMGLSPEEITGKTVKELWPGDMADMYHERDLELMQNREKQIYEYSIQDKDGLSRPVIFAKDLFFDVNGDVAGLVGAFIDISERIKAEKERELLKEQLAQSQKMDSVGRLAGGVAHDFNNMLGVILGYAELSLRKLSSEDRVYDYLNGICKATEKASSLTKQLLAFARKQIVSPSAININDNVEVLLSMIRRIIGENIFLEWKPGKSTGMIFIDPSQFDQMLFNLCVNARDAIRDTGKISIETESAVFDESYCSKNIGYIPGAYAVLAVSDDGQGIDDETMKHLFEPFYTTKKTGEGTGLGLATVDGIVKQNNGFINISSEPGQGTSLKIYLPQYSGEPEKTVYEKKVLPENESDAAILMVEDDRMLFTMNSIMLEELGYKVLAADTPDKAIRIADDYAGEIDLLITDVIMPGMNGKELADKIRELRPGIKILFMSGYTANIIGQHGVLDGNVHFIQKPFTFYKLADKVKESLSRTK